MDHPAYLQIVALLTRIQNYPGLSGLDYILDRVEIICCQNDYQLCEQLYQQKQLWPAENGWYQLLCGNGRPINVEGQCTIGRNVNVDTQGVATVPAHQLLALDLIDPNIDCKHITGILRGLPIGYLQHVATQIEPYVSHV